MQRETIITHVHMTRSEDDFDFFSILSYTFAYAHLPFRSFADFAGQDGEHTVTTPWPSNCARFAQGYLLILLLEQLSFFTSRSTHTTHIHTALLCSHTDTQKVIDILKFFSVYTLVCFAFACGMNQLLWYYADMERRVCLRGSVSVHLHACVCVREPTKPELDCSNKFFYTCIELHTHGHRPCSRAALLASTRT